MKWSKQAEEAVSRVPFFVRRRVRKRVEEEATRSGGNEVTLEHVKACQKRFLSNMEDEVKGYQVETCFGPGGCPNRAVVDDDLVRKLEELIAGKDLREFLKQHVQGPLKVHHEFRVSVSDCPNACSRPQIADLGLVGAVRPRLGQEACTQCGACVEICREQAVQLSDEADKPVVDPEKCVACGQCVAVCPSSTLEKDPEGYRIMLGGKLGRHPQLATELPGIYPKNEVLRLVEDCLQHYLNHNTHGERFGEIINRTGISFLCERPFRKDGE
ncbi:MAG: 4Fe-4S binding protein [Desulfomonile tiedjei]|nr:4Fe-4S binding protein [Desulfomonile tiedjei]